MYRIGMQGRDIDMQHAMLSISFSIVDMDKHMLLVFELDP